MAPSDANIYFSTLSTDGNTYVVALCTSSIQTLHCAVHYVSLNFQALVLEGVCNANGRSVLWSEKLTGSRKGDLRRRQNRAKYTFLITSYTTACAHHQHNDPIRLVTHTEIQMIDIHTMGSHKTKLYNLLVICLIMMRHF